ncbi:MAG: transglutaminase-like domain-containing protein [Candidatus Anammoxibacter sp.]
MDSRTAYSYIDTDQRGILSNIFGSNAKIISAINRAVPMAAKQSVKLSESFRGSTDMETARNIWEFLKREITYIPDGYWFQDIRLPSRFLVTSTGDCKSYSVFTAAILENLGVPFSLRYASYSNDPAPSHVYVVLSDGTVIDGVWHKFNSEKKYTYKKDYTMRIRTIAGHNDVLMNGVHGLRFLKVGGLALGRAAYLTLLKLNVRGWATKMSKLNSENWNKLRDKWYKLGGNRTTFKNAINKGKNKKRIFGTGYGVTGSGITPIGEPVTIATVLAAAAPIIIALGAFLKSLGFEKADDTSDGSSGGGGSYGGGGQYDGGDQTERYEDRFRYKYNDGNGGGPPPGDPLPGDPPQNKFGFDLPNWVLPVGLGLFALKVTKII